MLENYLKISKPKDFGAIYFNNAIVFLKQQSDIFLILSFVDAFVRRWIGVALTYQLE